VALLAARAPKLREAIRDAKKAGYAYVIVDGTLIPIDRVAADRPFYSGNWALPARITDSVGRSCRTPGWPTTCVVPATYTFAANVY
jgi:hypothetical protein